MFRFFSLKRIIYRILSKHHLTDEDKNALSNPEVPIQSQTTRIAAALFSNSDELLLNFIRDANSDRKDLGKKAKFVFLSVTVK